MMHRETLEQVIATLEGFAANAKAVRFCEDFPVHARAEIRKNAEQQGIAYKTAADHFKLLLGPEE